MVTKRLYVFTSSRRPITQRITLLLELYTDSITSNPSTPNPIISTNNPNTSHGYWFMQRCFASCIGYEVTNESQYGTDEQRTQLHSSGEGDWCDRPWGGDSKKRRDGRKKNEYLTRRKTDFMRSINFKLSTQTKERSLHYRHFLKVHTFSSVADIGIVRSGHQKPELRHWTYVQELAYPVEVKRSH